MPKRIQRKRTKGWKMSAGAIYVGRPTKWGNPFPVGMPTVDLPFIVVKRMAGELGESLTQEQAVEAYEIWMRHSYNGKTVAERAQKQLRGHDLACWCKEGETCHADVLLRIANEE